MRPQTLNPFAVGIGSVLVASSVLFFWLKIVGGLYLIYLGVKLLRKGFQGQAFELDVTTIKSSRWKSYVQGIGVALSNPKALLLIGTMFSQILDVTQPIPPQLAVLGVTLMIMSFSALMIYATVSKALLSKGQSTLFVLFGVALAVGSR